MRTPHERIAVARKIDNFLKDEDIVGILETMERQHIGEMCTADNSAKIFQAQAHTNAVKSFANRLRALVDDGEVAVNELKTAERRKREI